LAESIRFLPLHIVVSFFGGPPGLADIVKLRRLQF
jgi:hypothetical protein